MTHHLLLTAFQDDDDEDRPDPSEARQGAAADLGVATNNKGTPVPRVPAQPESVEVKRASPPPRFGATSHGLLSLGDQDGAGESDRSVPAFSHGSLSDSLSTSQDDLPNPAALTEIREQGSGGAAAAGEDPQASVGQDEGAETTKEKEDDTDGDVRRRKLRKMVASGYPSFHLLLSANYDNSDDETPLNDNVPVVPRFPNGDRLSAPLPATTTSIGPPPPLRRRRRPIYIDLDEELGLKPKRRRSERHSSRRNSQQQQRRRAGPDVTSTLSGSAPPAAAPSAADLGYYEGMVDVSTPDDDRHLSELHCWTRRQLEYFSASEGDARSLQAGRRTPLVPGRVGLRCKHCWRTAAAATSAAQTDTDRRHAWSSQRESASHQFPPPPLTATGAVSYPHNFGGIYAACAQKPALHFEQHCPGLPPEERQRLQVLLAHHHHQSSSSSSSRGGGPGRRTSAKASGGVDGTGGESIGIIPTTTYYAIAAKRLGIVEAAGGSGGGGLRFSRDLALDPLPLETMLRLEVASAAVADAGAGLADAESSEGGGGTTFPSAASVASLANGEQDEASPSMVPSATLPLEPRITADEESEQVLAEAVMELDDPSKYPGRVHDKAKVTDYFFLTLRQMAITNAVPTDFAGKGKKTRLMRVGFAGFCCRHCYEPNVLGGGGCRSFSSAADNLSSSISNSFVVHLQKCQNVPVRIKRALAAYKRLHQRQLAQIPYGSQRRLIHDLWSRLRACDVPEEEMNERIKLMEPPPSSDALDPPTPVGNGVPVPRGRPTIGYSQLDLPQSRPESFPECNDEETQLVLQRAMEEWDPEENDGLLLPSERYLISDFLFLTTRQLKVAFTDAASGGRRPNAGTAGLQCMHCMNKDQRIQVGTPSGKSFPSAPDNFASSMNSSLYGHMQACAFVPADIKRALYNVRKIHSNQCSNLKFGSQRRFFNILFDRLKAMNQAKPPHASDDQALEVGDSRSGGTMTAPTQVPHAASTRAPPPSVCASLGFVELTGPSDRVPRLWICTACRMVPMPLRFCGSCFTDTSLNVEDRMREHRAGCASGSFHLGLLARILESFFRDEQPQLSRVDVLLSDSFRSFVSTCVGGHAKLFQVLVHDLFQIILAGSDTNTSPATNMTNEMLQRSKGLWASFPVEVDSGLVLEEFQRFALAHGISVDLHQHPSLLKFALVIAPSLLLSTEPSTSPAENPAEIDLH